MRITEHVVFCPTNFMKHMLCVIFFGICLGVIKLSTIPIGQVFRDLGEGRFGVEQLTDPVF